MPRIDRRVAEYIDAYVAGWVLSRRTPQASRVPLGWHVPVGTEYEPERYVLTSGNEDDVRHVAESLPRAGSCLKFAGAHEVWRPVLGPDWQDNPIGWFMSMDIRPALGSATAPVSVDQILCWVKNQVAHVEVRVNDEVVASGRGGLAGHWCVPDRIRTSDGYRRRGLGRLVMQTLLQCAHDAGARRAVLDASIEGRALYRALGWSTVAPQFGVCRGRER